VWNRCNDLYRYNLVLLIRKESAARFFLGIYLVKSNLTHFIFLSIENCTCHLSPHHVENDYKKFANIKKCVTFAEEKIIK